MGLELGLGLREIGEIRFEIGVGESLAQLAYRVQLRVHGVEHVLGAPHDVTECNVPQLDSRVDEAEPQVRVAVGHLVRHDRAWLFGVQQCTHPAVAVVEILLPCAARIFVVPCLMPHRDARQAHRMESMLLGAQSVFDVIEFDDAGIDRPICFIQAVGMRQSHHPLKSTLNRRCSLGQSRSGNCA